VVRDDGLLQRNRPSRSAAPAQLIDAGHIAPGVVDTRSIEDVTPNDLRIQQCHFFAGIGGWSPHCVAQDGQTSPSMDSIMPLPTFQRGRQRTWVC
jgi:hypothetical protein